MKEVVFLALNHSDPEIDTRIIENCEVWTLNDYYRCYPWLEPTRIFQTHMNIDENVKNIQKGRPDRWQNWREKYNNSNAEIVTLKEDPGLKKQFVLDVKYLADKYGVEFFKSTLSYMAAEAIAYKYDKVHLMGFSMMEDYDYADCFPNCIYICDKMIEKGIKIESKILSDWKEKAKRESLLPAFDPCKTINIEINIPEKNNYFDMYGVL